MKRCHRCGVEVASEKVGARDACERCRAYLHCCRNCELYTPGMNNDCRETRAEPVADKEQGNFCDFFRFKSATASPVAAPSSRARASLEALFKKQS